MSTLAGVAPLGAARVLTPRAVISGFLLAVALCGINSYLTLSFGVIEEGPTIAALFFFAFFFLSKTKIRTPEMVIVATMGSAGGSLGFISNFFAAQTMVGSPYSMFHMVAFAVCTSLVGMVFVIPLREMLIVREDLPWPGSKATAGVIRALVEEGDPRQPYILLISLLVCMAYVVGNTEDGFGFVPDATAIGVFGLAAYGAAIAWSPFAIGGAYLMGFRTCVGFLFGGIALLAMAPWLPVKLQGAPHKYVWPGIGFLVASGLTLMAVNWRVIVSSMRSLVAARGQAADPDRIVSGRTLIALAIGAFVITAVYLNVAMGLSFVIIVALVVVGGFIQNVIATRAAAQTAFNPARVMGVLLEGITAGLGGSAAATNLTGAGMVAGSGAQAGNLTGDMAYGRWLGVPARTQFWVQIVTILPCAAVSAGVYSLIAAKSVISLEGGDLVAPVAKMWAASALVFEDASQMPPFALWAMLIGAVLGVIYVLLESRPALERWMPGSVGIGIGLVLPIAYDWAFFLGGFVLWIVCGRWLKMRDVSLTSVAVGAIVAEGLGGILKPVLHLVGILGNGG